MRCHRILYSELPHESRRFREPSLPGVGMGAGDRGENKLRSIFQTLHPPPLFLNLTKKLCLKEEHNKYSLPRLFKTEIKLLFLNETLSLLPIPPQPPAPLFQCWTRHVFKIMIFTFSDTKLSSVFLHCDDFVPFPLKWVSAPIWFDISDG